MFEIIIMGNCNLIPPISNPLTEGRQRILEFQRIRIYSEQTPSGTDPTVSSFLSFGTRAIASKNRRKPSPKFKSKESFDGETQVSHKIFFKKASITTNDLENTARATPQSKSMSIDR